MAEDDRTVAVDAAAATADAMGVSPVLLGSDWELRGHAHMFIIEDGSELIAQGVLEWLQECR